MGSVKKPQTAVKAEGKTAAQRHSRASEGKKKGGPKPWNHSHVPPKQQERAKNGRHEGRNLITWTRPRMAEKLLLHLQYECSRYKIELPWDSIAHRLHPGSSGGAIQQHMNRLRGTLVAEGHLVPPICQKPGSRVVVDPKVRGYVRKYTEGPDTVTTRQVLFTEPMDDRKFNLPDAYDNVKVMGAVKSEGRGGGSQKTTSKPTPVKNELLDLADPDDDGDYDPNGKTTATRRRSSRAKATRSYVEEEDNEYDMNEDYDEESTSLEGKSSDFKMIDDDDFGEVEDWIEEDDYRYGYDQADEGDDGGEDNGYEGSRSSRAPAHNGTNGHHAVADSVDGPPTTATFDEDHNPFLPANGVSDQDQENGYGPNGGDEGLADEYDDEVGDMEIMDHEDYDGRAQDGEADKA